MLKYRRIIVLIDMEQMVETRWNNLTKSHYVNKGYVFTGIGDVIKVRVADLPIKSAVRIKYICDICGETIETAYNHYTRSNEDICHKCSSAIKLPLSRKLKFETIIAVFNDRGYKLISSPSEYKTGTSKLRYICEHHGEKTITYESLMTGRGCRECSNDRKRGKNSYSWKGGVTALCDYMRTKLDHWIQQQLKRSNYTCEITGKHGILNVHHMYSFSNILQDTMSELQLDIKPNVGDYSEEELELITVNFLKNNNLNANPVVMLESVHKDFHSFCGGSKYNTTMKQLDEFKKTLHKEVS